MGRQQPGERVGAVSATASRSLLFGRPVNLRLYVCRPVSSDGASAFARYYVSDANAIRYMHRHLRNLPAGQYELLASGLAERHVAYLYRTVDQ